jgi:phage tail sheath protein FI
MTTYLTPGVYFESTDQGGEGITAIRTDIAAFVGIAQRGPLNRPVAVNSWEQFQTAFGDFITNGYLAYSAKAFFENGGQRFYGVRVAAPAASTATDPAAVQPADGSASIVLSVAGFAPGAVVTAQQTAAAAAAGVQPADRASSLVDTVSGFAEGSLVKITQTVPAVVHSFRKVQAVDAVAKRLTWSSALDAAFVLTQPIQFTAFHHTDLVLESVTRATNTLTWTAPLGPAFNFNLAQSIEFDTGASAAHGVLFDADGNPTVRIDAASPGAWGDGLAIHVAQESPAATTTTPQTQPAAGSASFVASLVGFAKGSLVKAFQPGVAPQYRIVTGIDATTNLVMWDSPLVAPLDLTETIYFETLEFSLTIYVNQVAKEVFPGLSLDRRHARYVEAAVNASTSQYIRASDLGSSAPYPDRLPAPAAPQLENGVLRLWGGRDGIAALRALDFIGDPTSQTKSGIRTLEDVDEVSIVCAPDILIEPGPAVVYKPEPPVVGDPCLPGTTPVPRAPSDVAPPVEAAPKFSLDDVYRVQQAMVTHCEAMQYRFAILDPPDFSFPREHVDLGEVQSWRNRFDTKYAALYYPWIFVVDPLEMRSQLVRRIPPSGHAAGVYANTDLTIGVHKAPANVELAWAQDVTTEVSAEMQGFLNPIGVDCIRMLRGRGLRIYGARTVSSNMSWRFVNVRRLVSMIEHALEISLQWAVFEPNNFYLWQTVRISIASFLETLWQRGALAGNTAEDAFFVKCDQLNNPLSSTSVGRMIAEVGVAPTQPAEFVIFRIGRTADTLEVTEPA